MAQRLHKTKATPTYREETRLMEEGYSLVAGLDEVGRGPLAGPVVAGVAILPPNPKGPWTRLIRDSKQLTPLQREKTLPHIEKHALALEIGICTSQEIDVIGIVEATRLAMCRALEAIVLNPSYLLLDAIKLPQVNLPQKSIIRGDSTCLSIAAASIVAKVARDRMMEQEDENHPGYGFSKHKGYGTREHISNLKRLGPCSIHRYSFAPVRDMAAGHES